VAAWGIRPRQATCLINGAIAWLLNRQHPPHARSRFGYGYSPGVVSGDARLAWCYGDLGIAGILHQVSVLTGSDECRRVANSLMAHSMGRMLDGAGVSDAGLCHGAMGVSHIFNRAFQTECDPRYKDAAIRWLIHGLAMRHSAVGIDDSATSRGRRPLCVPAPLPDPSFLTGSVGMGLALLAASSDIAPRWDRWLLLSNTAPTVHPRSATSGVGAYA
jgi:hypothetical protein